MRPARLLAIPMLVAAAAVLPVPASARVGAVSGRTHCGSVRGVAWSLHAARLHVSGNRYVVSTEGSPSCALARRWVLGLTRQQNHGFGATVKGPSGYACRSSMQPEVGGKLAVAGGCNGGGADEFQWAPLSSTFRYS